MAVFGFGVLLKRGDGASPESFTAIAELIGLTPMGMSRDTVETTHTSSTNQWREFIAGLKDAGEVTAEVNFLPSDNTQNFTNGIGKDFKDGTVRNFQIVFPDSGTTTWSFSAIVTGYAPATPIDDRMTASITMKVTGEPTLS